MSKQTAFIGDKFKTTNGVAEIVHYKDRHNVTVQFECGTLVVCRLDHLREGHVNNPNQPDMFGIGYLGIGPYKPTSYGKITKAYEIWRGMMRRCYDKEYQNAVARTYIGCSVDSYWHSFQNFAKDYYVLSEGREDWDLDKDLSVIGNRVYSNETCTMLPSELNSLLGNSKAKRGDLPVGVSFYKPTKKYKASIGRGKLKQHLGYFDTIEDAFNAYKIAKEDWIKQQANKWKSQIDPRAYEALMNYVVEITD